MDAQATHEVEKNHDITNYEIETNTRDQANQIGRAGGGRGIVWTSDILNSRNLYFRKKFSERNTRTPRRKKKKRCRSDPPPKQEAEEKNHAIDA